MARRAKAARAMLWGGRFARATHPVVACYTSSIAVDHALARYDVLGSIAHAKMLGRCRIIPAAAAARLAAGLARLLRAIDQGRFAPDPRAEDIHTQVQAALERAIGPVARTLQTARSRNDQVALDLRLYCRDAVARVDAGVREAQRALVALGRRYPALLIPGYTHLQRAQPVLAAHHLLAYVEMLARDRERLRDAAARINVLPLGAGALAGTSLPIDRRYVATLLGFPRVAENSMDAVADRDFAVELVAALALLGAHLSRLAEDLILWNTAEFGLLELDDAVATGSSLMPQKKNPDVLELIRGQAGLVASQLAALLALLKGLPLAYNRDLQWDKRCVFAAVEDSVAALGALAVVLRHARLRPAQAAALLRDGATCATDLAEYLVTRGVAFADAHAIVGRAVAHAERQGVPLDRLPLAALRRFSPRFEQGALACLDPRRSAARKRSEGSTNPAQVRRALTRWERRLKGARLANM